jgi:hypothetical protein
MSKKQEIAEIKRWLYTLLVIAIVSTLMFPFSFAYSNGLVNFVVISIMIISWTTTGILAQELESTTTTRPVIFVMERGA